MKSRMPRRYVGAGEDEFAPLLGGRNNAIKPASVNRVLIGIVAAIALSAFVMGIISMAWGKNDVDKMLKLDSLNVSGPAKINDLTVIDNFNVLSPSNPGPYDVGHIKSTVTLNGHETFALIWYPVTQGPIPRHEIQSTPRTTYDIFYNSVFSFFSPTEVFQQPSAYNAIINATIAPGTFPLSIMHHGSGERFGTNDNGYIYGYAKNLEHYASHGIVSVVFGRAFRGTLQEEASDISELISYMGTGFEYAASVNVSKTIVIGHSSGLGGALHISGGGDNQTFTDTRVVGFVNMEGGTITDFPAGYFVDMEIPSMHIGRETPEFPGYWSMVDTLPVLTKSFPRYLLHVNGASHLTFEGSRALQVDVLRTKFLKEQKSTVDPLVLNGNTADIFGYFLGLSAEERVCFLHWYVTELFFGEPPQFPVEPISVQPNNIIGVKTPFVNLDTNNDGFTDVTSYATTEVVSSNTADTELSDSFEVVQNFLLSQTEYDSASHLDGFTIRIISGTGTGQSRTITGWTGSPAYTATVDAPWNTAPDNTSVMLIEDVKHVYRRQANGEFIELAIERIGLDEQFRIQNGFITAFIKSVAEADVDYNRTLTADSAAKYQNVGLTRFETSSFVAKRAAFRPPFKRMESMPSMKYDLYMTWMPNRIAELRHMANMTK